MRSKVSAREYSATWRRKIDDISELIIALTRA